MARKQFTLNPKKEKERVILDLLSTFYDETASIKEILYNYAITQNAQVNQNEKNEQISQIEKFEQKEQITHTDKIEPVEKYEHEQEVEDDDMGFIRKEPIEKEENKTDSFDMNAFIGNLDNYRW